MEKHYLLYYFERLQDGHEESVKLFSSLKLAIDYINDFYNKGIINLHNMTIKLFELGKEIELEQSVEIEVTEIKKEVKTFSVKGGI